MNKNSIVLAIFASSVLAVQPSAAGDAKKGGAADHGAMHAPGNTAEAQALGVVNAIDVKGRSMNITHEPVQALGWPKMTMDLPVTRRVDLSAVEVGTTVRFRLKQGRDKRFRIVAIEAAE